MLFSISLNLLKDLRTPGFTHLYLFLIILFCITFSYCCHLFIFKFFLGRRRSFTICFVCFYTVLILTNNLSTTLFTWKFPFIYHLLGKFTRLYCIFLGTNRAFIFVLNNYSTFFTIIWFYYVVFFAVFALIFIFLVLSTLSTN